MATFSVDSGSGSDSRPPKVVLTALRVAHRMRPLMMWLGRLESWLLRRRLRQTSLDRPIYICGVPRCGSTITLELLGRHRDVASHRYADMLMPYVPYAWSRIAPRLAKRVDAGGPKPRLHRDRIDVTSLSPESAEELLWLPFFEGLHDQSRSCVLTGEDDNAAFERFYGDTLGKLMLARDGSRYLSKANYNTTRIAYLHHILPDARFVVLIRHPRQHVASLLKQDRLLTELGRDDPSVTKMTRVTGHFDFGPGKVWQRVSDRVDEIARCYDAGRHARAWAMHWADVYDLVWAQLRDNPSLAAATTVVRYEDLCERSGEVIDRMVSHCQLDADPFAQTRASFVERLSKPKYYRVDFEPDELADIDEVTRRTRDRFGYGDTPDAERAPVQTR